MNFEFVTLRWLHIIPGVIWVGSAIFLAIVILPRAKTAVATSGFASYVDIFSGAAKLMNASGGIAIIFGLALLFRMRFNALDTIFTTSWGWAILVGIVASTIAMATTGMLGGVASSIQGTLEDDDSTVELEVLTSRLQTATRLTAIFVIIAISAMASARFV